MTMIIFSSFLLHVPQVLNVLLHLVQEPDIFSQDLTLLKTKHNFLSSSVRRHIWCEDHVSSDFSVALLRNKCPWERPLYRYDGGAYMILKLIFPFFDCLMLLEKLSIQCRWRQIIEKRFEPTDSYLVSSIFAHSKIDLDLFGVLEEPHKLVHASRSRQKGVLDQHHQGFRRRTQTTTWALTCHDKSNGI